MIFVKKVMIYNFNIATKRLFSSSCLALQQGFCHYDILGVDRNASKKDIRVAYLQKTKQYHPDSNPDDESLHEKFVKVTNAYQVLNDDHSRTLYNNSTSHSNVVTQTHASRRARRAHSTSAANPFGSYVDEEDPYWGWSEEMKRKMYEDFYENQYPEYLKQQQEEWDARRRRSGLILLSITGAVIVFGIFNFTRILNYNEGYRRRTDRITAENAAYLADRRTGYRAYIKRQKEASDAKNSVS